MSGPARDADLTTLATWAALQVRLIERLRALEARLLTLELRLSVAGPERSTGDTP